MKTRMMKTEIGVRRLTLVYLMVAFITLILTQVIFSWSMTNNPSIWNEIVPTIKRIFVSEAVVALVFCIEVGSKVERPKASIIKMEQFMGVLSIGIVITNLLFFILL